MVIFKKIRRGIQGLKSKKVKNPRLYRPPYVDIHKGRDFLILATGPSVEKYKREITDFIYRVNPVTIGCNNVSMIYNPDYHGFTNRRRLIENIAAIDEKKTKVIISPYIAKWVIKEHFKGKYWPLMFINSSENDFGISNGILSCSCGTSALVLVGVAIVMGANDIYIAGLDGYSKYFLSKEKINCLATKTKYNSFEKDREHYLRLQKLNEHYLRQIDEYFFAKTGNHLKIITPTIHKAYYNRHILRLE